MPKVLKYTLQISLYYGLMISCTLYFLNIYSKVLSISGKVLARISFSERSTQKQSKYTLQNRVYSKKHSKYTLKVLKSTLNIQKNTQKQIEALDNHSKCLLFTMRTELFLLIFQYLNHNTHNTISIKWHFEEQY